MFDLHMIIENLTGALVSLQYFAINFKLAKELNDII